MTHTHRNIFSNHPFGYFYNTLIVLIMSGEIMAGCSHSLAVNNTNGGGLIFTNLTDPRIVQVNDSLGNTITYYGEKDASGIPTKLSGYSMTPAGNPTQKSWVAFDGSSRVSLLTLPSGFTVDFSYVKKDSVILYFNDDAGHLAIVSTPAQHSSTRHSGGSVPLGIKSSPSTLPVQVTVKNGSQVNPVTDANVLVRFVSASGKGGQDYTIQATNDGQGNYSVPIPGDFTVSGVSEYSAKVLDALENLIGKACQESSPKPEEYFAALCPVIAAAYPVLEPLCPILDYLIVPACSVSEGLQNALGVASSYITQHDNAVVFVTCDQFNYGQKVVPSFSLNTWNGDPIAIQYVDSTSVLGLWSNFVFDCTWNSGTGYEWINFQNDGTFSSDNSSGTDPNTGVWVQNGNHIVFTYSDAQYSGTVQNASTVVGATTSPDGGTCTFSIAR